MPVQIFCFKLCSILLNDEKTLDSFILPSYLRYKKGLDLNLQPPPPPPPTPLFVATPLMKSTYEEVQLVILRVSSQ